MACDESLYRQYLNGDDEGLNALMKKYGDPLTLYIDGYLHDVHEAEELMLDVFAYLDARGNAGHGEGRADEQRKARRHGGSHGDRIAPPPFLPLNFGDAPLCLRDALFMTPHL